MDSSILAGILHTNNTFPFASDNRSNKTLCSWQRGTVTLPTPLNTYLSCSGDSVLTSELPVPRPPSFPHPGNGHMMPTTYYSGQGTRELDLLDTRMWAPCPSFVTEHAATFEPQLPLMDVMSNASTLPFLTGSRLAPDMGPTPHALMYTQSDPAQALISEFSSGTGYHRTDLETEYGHHVSLTNSIPASSSSSTEDVTSSVNDEKKKRLPVVIYRPAEKKGSSRPRSRRACAINIDGIWIDKEELSSGAEQIVVHECQWDKDGNPCDMWIVGSRSSVGAHVRKWHAHTHTEGRATCMWDGCKKNMTQGSLNRHVLTAHLEERFHCQGCKQTYSRKDVYGQHVEKEKGCKGVGAAVVYSTERRVVDIREALQQEGALRYSS